jgi:hypothetical protein
MMPAGNRVANTRRSWTRIIGWAAVAILVAATCVGGSMAYLGISASLRAEENLHSTTFVIRLVEQFVAEQKRWPQSWQELESLPFSSEAPRPGNGELSVVRIGGQHGYEWPAASKDLQRRVAIDFGVDPMKVAEQDPMSFTAIKPIGPYYEYRHYGFVQSLQETIRNVTQSRTAAEG